jgi:hypothetical protein
MRHGETGALNMSYDHNRKPAPQPPQYAEEVLCANWSPLALMLAEPPARAPGPEFDGSDVESLIARLYQCQQA